MKRRIFALILALVLFGALAVSVSASNNEMLVDAAGLLSAAQQDALSAKLEKYRDTLQVEIIVITVDSMNGNESEDYANAVYDNYSYGYGNNRDGVMLLVSMEDRDWYILANGMGNRYVNKDAQKLVSDAVVPLLSSGNYSDAFTLFADMSAQLIVDGMDGNIYKAPFPFLRNFGIALAISLLIATGVTGKYRGELKSVRAQKAAASYVTDGSLQLTNSHEQYLYHQITKTAKPKSSSSSGSSGGRSGSGGKF